MLWPRGGSSSTVTRNSPASSLRCEQGGRGAGGEPGGLGGLHPGATRPARRARRGARGAQPVERLPHRADVLGRRPAAAADQARAARDHPRRVVRHVDRRGEVHQPLAHPARQPRVGLDGHVEAARLRQHLLQDVVEHAGADRAVGAHRLDRQLPQRAATSAAAAPGEGHALVGERHLGEDRQVGEGAHRLDRQPHLGEVREGLDHEGVDAAFQEPLRLLVERGARVRRLDAAERGQVLAERADRAQHDHVAPHALAHVARQLGAAQVDLAHARLQAVDAELEAVGAEGIRLDASQPAAMYSAWIACTSLGSLRLSTSKQASSDDAAGVEQRCPWRRRRGAGARRGGRGGARASRYGSPHPARCPERETVARRRSCVAEQEQELGRRPGRD